MVPVVEIKGPTFVKMLKLLPAAKKSRSSDRQQPEKTTFQGEDMLFGAAY